MTIKDRPSKFRKCLGNSKSKETKMPNGKRKIPIIPMRVRRSEKAQVD